MLEIAIWSSGASMVTVKVALRAGSSQQGRSSRAGRLEIRRQRAARSPAP